MGGKEGRRVYESSTLLGLRVEIVMVWDLSCFFLSTI
jgi:hypothetical protein